MGQKGRAVVELNVEELIRELRKAYLDELLAFYSYWITAQIAEGFPGEELAEHLAEEAKDELGHAGKLARPGPARGGGERDGGQGERIGPMPRGWWRTRSKRNGVRSRPTTAWPR